jgi:starch synthase
MKALLLTNEYPPHVYGGAGVHVEYLSRELARLMDVDVRCFGDQDASAGGLRIKGYGINEGLFTATDPKLRSPFQALERCVRFAAEPVDAEVVHCHTWYSHLGGIIVKLAYGIPLVITAHSLEPLRSWKREQLGRGYDLSSWLERTAMTMADRIIGVSTAMKEDIVRLFDVAADRVSVIYNGIDAEEYRAVTSTAALVRHGIDPRVPYVLFVGRITRQKGLAHLVRAIPHVRRDAQIVLCAGAPDTKEIGEEMTRLVHAVQRERPGVIWIREMVDKPTVIELYSHAAVFCCPSIYEPFGIINLEAMACGTAVVASAVGGIPEVVVDGETGLLVPFAQQKHEPFEPIDPDGFARGLAAAINRLLADEALRRNMGSAGRRRVEGVFSWRALACQVRHLYEEVVQAQA